MDGIQKILLIRFSSIGDIVLASPLIRLLKSNFPHAQIDVLVKAEYAELIQFNPHLSNVIELHSSAVSELWSLAQCLRHNSYDVVLDIHDSLRSRLIRFFSGARRIGKVNKHIIARFLLVKLGVNFYKDPQPVAVRYLRTAQSLGIGSDNKRLELFVPDGIRDGVSATISTAMSHGRGPLVGIAPGAKHNTKMWMPERFAEIATRAVRELDAGILIFGGRSDARLCGEIFRTINAPLEMGRVLDLSGRLSLLQTAAALDHCDLLLCNDTGIMHIAAARQRRVVAVFGPTVEEFGFYPYGTEAVVIERKGLSCRPCSHLGSSQCPVGHFRCMKDTSVDEVFNAVCSLVMKQQTVS